ncbi:MAG: hypothetical protein KDH90_12080 [Anaerolineae bacterium]|nr:hypothetical protein [Anaerolineae bacterium]
MATPNSFSGKRISRKPGRVNRIYGVLAALLAATQVWSGAAVASQPVAPVLVQPAVEWSPAGNGASLVLAAANGDTIRFMPQNGKEIDGVKPQLLSLPHLVLRRNGQLTDAAERTLVVFATGLDIDPAGTLVSLELTTMHRDPDAGEYGPPIVVERVGNFTTSSAVTFTVTLQDSFGNSKLQLATPTDYYSLTLIIITRDGQRTNLATPYAFLVESQWIAPLPAATEEMPGAAPDSLIIWYTDMVPFQRVAGQPDTRLARAEVDDFVGATVLPELVEAFRVQSNEWGFTWHQAWTGLRGGDDAERLSVALGDGATWFHGSAPAGANSSIAINVSNGLSSEYATLADGIVSVFHHELFHNLQRDLRQALAGEGDVDGPGRAWAFITEGMAVAVQSVARPDLEYGASSEARAFYSWSNEFLNGDEALNTSYAELNPYEGALYWRFLFEAAGGMDDPAAGMTVLRNVLEVMYGGEVVDIGTSDDLVRYLPEIVSRGLARTPNSPFQTYEESLRSFARSIYRSPEGEGLYDPGRQFARPVSETISFPPAAVRFDPQNLPTPRGIGSSYGIDFVQIAFEPDVQGMPVEIEVRGATGSAAEFDVEVLGIVTGGSVISTLAAPEKVRGADSRGQVANVVLNETGEQLAGALVIIVRVDNREAQDGAGRYELNIRPVYEQL